MQTQSQALRELFKAPKRKTYLMMGVTVLLVGVCIVFAIRPMFARIAKLNKEIEDKQIFLEKVEQKLENLNYLIQEKHSASKELVFFEKDFPEEVKEGFIIANLAQIAQDYDIDLLRIHFDEKIKTPVGFGGTYEENLSVVQVSVGIEGDSLDLERYIEHLEVFPMVFDIKSVGYSKVELCEYTGDLRDYRPLEADLSMYLYIWTEDVKKSESN